MPSNRILFPAALAVLACAAGCASRTVVPPLPATLAYPEFLYPTVPPSLARVEATGGIDRGWRYLQSNDLANADREFAAALKRSPALYPAQAGAAYVALARRDYEGALGRFDAVLQSLPMYVPGLVGRGQALLALERDAAALEAFEAALAVDSTLADVRRRVDVLQFRGLQEVIEAARRAAAGGRLADSAAAYERALQTSPDSAFLHRELGQVERKRGSAEAALDRFRRAVELESGDAVSYVQIGELLEERQDFGGAESAYRRAADIEPSGELSARIASVVEKARDARLPAQFRAIGGSTAITRGELAALVGVRLDDVLRGAAVRDVVMTDTQGHWAAAWIVQVARAGVMEPFANHTFQPGTRITRAELAGAASRLVTLIAAGRSDLRVRLADRPQVADMPQGHLSYPAVSMAIASGVMPLPDDRRFQPAGPVPGSQALDVVARLRALADPSR